MKVSRDAISKANHSSEVPGQAMLGLPNCLAPHRFMAWSLMSHGCGLSAPGQCCLNNAIVLFVPEVLPLLCKWSCHLTLSRARSPVSACTNVDLPVISVFQSVLTLYSSDQWLPKYMTIYIYEKASFTHASSQTLP